MNIKQAITDFHYKKSGKFVSFLLFIVFLIPSILYSFVIKIKNSLYDLGLAKEESLHKSRNGAKIICIGNLTTGGVGKTPVTIEFAKYLSGHNKVSTLSRGYGGSLKNPAIVRDFDKILIENPVITGDEVKLIAENASPKDINIARNAETQSGFAVIVSKDRKKGAELAIEKLGAEIIIMDDGFSNRKLKKDLSLLLFDAKKFIGNGFLLPLGPLREPLSEIKRADGIIIVDKENTDTNTPNKLETFLESAFKKPVFISNFAPDCFYNILTGETISIKGKPVFAFSAIGQPEQFYNLLYPKNEASPALKGTLSFDDHHKYAICDLEKIVKKAKESDAKYIITTEKDAVKIKPMLEVCKNIEKDTPEILAMKLKTDVNVSKILSKLNFKYGASLTKQALKETEDNR